MDTRGRHVIAELDGCEAGLLSDPLLIRRLMLEAADEAGATVLGDDVYEFHNGGVSAFVLLAESHISIHTWPEHRYAALDIYTCGHHTMPDLACQLLAERLGATGMQTSALDRGLTVAMGEHEHRHTVQAQRIFRPSPVPTRTAS